MKQDQNHLNIEDCDLSLSPLFKHLTPQEVEKISEDKKVNFYKKGTAIYAENNRVIGCYIVMSGILKIFKTGKDGREQIIRFARPFDLISFRSVLNDELACTTAKTIEDSILCFIPKDTLFYLIKN